MKMAPAYERENNDRVRLEERASLEKDQDGFLT